VTGAVPSMLWHRSEQLRAVDLHRLDKHMGRLTRDEQSAVDEAMELVLGL